jgi:hypothetical protein
MGNTEIISLSRNKPNEHKCLHVPDTSMTAALTVDLGGTQMVEREFRKIMKQTQEA